LMVTLSYDVVSRPAAAPTERLRARPGAGHRDRG
jgi:hypothetical protein